MLIFIFIIFEKFWSLFVHIISRIPRVHVLVCLVVSHRSIGLIFSLFLKLDIFNCPAFQIPACFFLPAQVSFKNLTGNSYSSYCVFQFQNFFNGSFLCFSVFPCCLYIIFLTLSFVFLYHVVCL